MNIRIQCPLCGFHKEVPTNLGGREVKCPHCETKFNIPLPQVTTLEASPKLGPKLAPKPAPKATGRASGVRARPRRRSKWPVVVAGLVVALAAGGTAAYFVLLKGGERETAEGARTAAATSPSARVVDDDARLAADKKAAEDKAARDKAEALARKQQEEQARAEKERLQKEADQRALAENKERERQERLVREEKERKEREAKEEAARVLFEKRNPKLTATPEEVDGDPEKFFGKRLYFDNVRLKADAIKKPKDMEVYTLGVTSKGNKYYSPVVLASIFFSADNHLVQAVQKEWDLVEMFPRVRLYCEIRSYEKKPGAKPLPQAHIFKLQIYNTQGSLVKTWEEPEADTPPPAKEGEKKPQ
jgi:hypothetical protein